MQEMRRFVSNIAKCYSSRNIWWQILAVALTYFIVVSGFDWYYYTSTRDAVLQSWLFPASIIGGVLPVLLPFVLYLIGNFGRNKRALHTAYALAQAAIIGLMMSSFYKVFTGRIPPPFRTQDLVDISRQFEFGFFRDGAFWGWPSSHTTIAFAMAVTIFILYQKNKFLKYAALLVAFYIGIGVSTNIHWFSEFVAGAIFGSIIGVVVGKSFKMSEAAEGE